MKSPIEKKMRKIRLQLKKHTTLEYDKSVLREKLEQLRERLIKEKEELKA